MSIPVKEKQDKEEVKEENIEIIEEQENKEQ